MDQASLLAQLRIERPVQHAPRRAAWRWSAVIALAVIAVTRVPLSTPGCRVPYRSRSLSPSPCPKLPRLRRAPILDASGYVVARRQATVSAKITGKVVDGRHRGRATRRARRNHRATRRHATRKRPSHRRAPSSSKARRTLAAARGRVRERDADVRAQRAAVRARGHQRADVRHGESQLRRGAHGSRRRRARASKSRRRGSRSRERNLDDTVVRAPFAGIVTVKAAQEGEMVSPMSAGGGFTRTGIGTIVDMSLARGRGRRQRELHQSRRAAAARDGQIERVSGLDHPGARHRHHSDGRSRESHRQGARRFRRRRRADPARDGRARGVPRCGRRRRRRLGHEDDRAQRPCSCRRRRCKSTATPVSCSSSPTAASSGAPCASARRARRGRSCCAGLTSGTRMARGDLASLADGSRVRVEE